MLMSHQPHMGDLPEVHHVRDKRIRTRNAPFAQRLNLGWVVVGDMCLGNFHSKCWFIQNYID